MKLVSIIIPAYNCEKYINKCIDSILEQSYSKTEILISDDGSTDRTRELVDAYDDPRILRHHNVQNMGNVYTRNNLMSKATGDFICIQDADDWSAPDRIQAQLDYLVSMKAEACTCNVIRVGMDGRETKGSMMPATIMISRNVYDDIGGIPHVLERIIAEDLYWISRIKDKFKLIHLDRHLYYYQDNLASLSNTINDNMLIGPALVNELNRQRAVSKTDWVIENDTNSIDSFKQNLLNDDKWLQKRLLHLSVVMYSKDLKLARMLYKKSFNYGKIRMLTRKHFWIGLKLGLWRK